MQNIYTYFNEASTHNIENEPMTTDIGNAIIKCDIDLYTGETDQNKKKLPVGTPIGSIKGILVLGREIELLTPENVTERDEIMNLFCDDVSFDLGYVVSALLENNGPLCIANTVFGIDHFYIQEVKVEDPSMLPAILSGIPMSVFSHLHVFPDILSYYPKPLPHEQKQTSSGRVMGEVAKLTQATIADRVFSGQYDPEKLHLVLTKEQHRIITGMRHPSDSYPEEYINREIWQPYLDAGFHEWGNTRVLYKFADREA